MEQESICGEKGKNVTRCAFCGRMTNFYSKELECYICINCLSEYIRAWLERPHQTQFENDFCPNCKDSTSGRCPKHYMREI